MKNKNPGLEWKARKWTAFVVAAMLERLHGEDSAQSWLWGMTPFPSPVPRWHGSFLGPFAPLCPAPLSCLYACARWPYAPGAERNAFAPALGVS